MRLASPSRSAALSGGLLFATTALPALAPLVFVAFVPWLATLDTPSRAARSGWVLGLVFWGLNLSWCLQLVVRLGTIWPAAAWLGQVLVLGVVTAGAGALVAVLASRLPLWIAAPLGWMAVEWARGSLLGPLNFPWSPVALSLVYLRWWTQPAAWVGAWGLGLGVMAVNGLAARAVMDRRRASGGRLPAVALLLVLIWGASGAVRLWRLQTEPVVTAAVVQPAIPLDPGRPAGEAEARALRALEVIPDSLGAQIVVLPETLFPAVADRRVRPGIPLWSQAVDSALRVLARRWGAPVLTGGYASGREAPRNAVFLLGPGDPTGPEGLSAGSVYEKRALVPGVEWTPTGGLERGEARGVLDAPGRPGVLICVESAWEGLASEHARSGARWLVNTTNDAWLAEGEVRLTGFAFRQHPAHLQLRSLETGLGALRAGNTGLSGVTGPDGSWIRLLAPHEPGFAVGEIRSATGLTFFQRYGRWIAPGLSLLALAAGLQGLLVRRRRPVDRSPTRI